MVAYPLQSYLTKNGISYSALARQLGVRDTTVMRWAKGERRPSVDMALVIERETHGDVKVSDWCRRPSRRRTSPAAHP